MMTAKPAPLHSQHTTLPSAAPPAYAEGRVSVRDLHMILIWNWLRLRTRALDPCRLCVQGNANVQSLVALFTVAAWQHLLHVVTGLYSCQAVESLRASGESWTALISPEERSRYL